MAFAARAAQALQDSISRVSPKSDMHTLLHAVASSQSGTHTHSKTATTACCDALPHDATVAAALQVMLERLDEEVEVCCAECDGMADDTDLQQELATFEQV